MCGKVHADDFPPSEETPPQQVDRREAGRQKHFLVTKVIEPELEGGKAEWVELEAIMTKGTVRIGWRAFRNTQVWQQGWK